MMLQNNELKLHFVNVNHGDATIVELPDYGTPAIPHFAVVDFGAQYGPDRVVTRDYMQSLVDLRRDGDANFDYAIDFLCVTHPHMDHFGGLEVFMEAFEDTVSEFWDCGFRTNSDDYNTILTGISENDSMTFTRVSSGSEFEFGPVRFAVLAPSIDLRNRFDTFGVNKNNASIVLMVLYNRARVILGGDAQFDSWGTTFGEFPRHEEIDFHDDALGLAERDEGADQLACNLLRLSHHGSKHGATLECIERLDPEHAVVPAGSQNWYNTVLNIWGGSFPHPIITDTLSEVDANMNVYVTGEDGNVIFKYRGGVGPRQVRPFVERPGDAGFDAALDTAWRG